MYFNTLYLIDSMNESLGGFEHHVLLALTRIGETYSVPIVVELEQRTGRTVAPAAVFVTLRRLEKRGLLVSRVAPPEPGQTGRPGLPAFHGARGRARYVGSAHFLVKG